MVLKVSDQVTPDEIVKVFRRLAAMHHPDRLIQSTTEERQAAGKRFAQIRQAFEVLSQS